MHDILNFPNVTTYAPASDTEIHEIEDGMKSKLPDVYKQLLRITNGAAFDSGITIYGTQDMVERNETWEVTKYSSGYIAIGDDSGGNVFLMLAKVTSKEVIVVDAGDMNPSNGRIVTLDFAEWVNTGCLQEKNTSEDLPDVCNIVLVKTPAGGLKDLLAIKSVLGIDLSSSELLKGSKNPPFLLFKGYPYGKAKKRIEALGSIAEALSLVGIHQNI